MVLTRDDFRAGDVLLFSGCDPASLAIKLASVPPWYWPVWRPWEKTPHWRWISHVALICDWHSEPLLIESTTMNDYPCAVRHIRTHGVQAHRPAGRVERYDGWVWRMRPVRGWELTNERRDELAKFVHWQFGERYDFGGAMRSVTRWPTLYREQRRFCSDLLHAALARVGLVALDNPKRYSPSRCAGLMYGNGNFSKPKLIKAPA